MVLRLFNQHNKLTTLPSLFLVGRSISNDIFNK
jgi:hypothetical protein